MQKIKQSELQQVSGSGGTIFFELGRDIRQVIEHGREAVREIKRGYASLKDLKGSE